MDSKIDELSDVAAALVSGWVFLFIGVFAALIVGHGLLRVELEWLGTHCFVVAVLLLGVIVFRLVGSSLLAILRLDILYVFGALALTLAYSLVAVAPLSAIWLYEFFADQLIVGNGSWLQWCTQKMSILLVDSGFMDPSNLEAYVTTFSIAKVVLTIGSLVSAWATQALLFRRIDEQASH